MKSSPKSNMKVKRGQKNKIAILKKYEIKFLFKSIYIIVNLND